MQQSWLLNWRAMCAPRTGRILTTQNRFPPRNKLLFNVFLGARWVQLCIFTFTKKIQQQFLHQSRQNFLKVTIIKAFSLDRENKFNTITLCTSQETKGEQRSSWIPRLRSQVVESWGKGGRIAYKFSPVSRYLLWAQGLSRGLRKWCGPQIASGSGW